MPKKTPITEDRLHGTLQSLDEQCDRLREIHQAYHSAYDTAFDQNGAVESIKRWHDRTTKVIEDRVSAAEAVKFRRLLSQSWGQCGRRGSWKFGELVDCLHTFLVRLVEDIEEHSDDPSYDRLLNPAATVKNVKTSPKESPIASHYVFLSYSTLDKDEARHIRELVEGAGKTCFLSEKNIEPGEAVRNRIREALKASEELWLLVSPNSKKSDWVRNECAAAWALEKSIVPILLRCSPIDLPDLLSDTQAIDYHKVDSLVSRLRAR